MTRRLLVLALLAGCSEESLTTKEGCPIMMTELGQAQTRACQRAYYEEQARQRGATITRCMGEADDFTCITG